MNGKSHSVVPILYDEELLKHDIVKYLCWNPQVCPHAVIVGATGSGKTYFAKLFLGKLVLYLPDCSLYVCDFKGDDDFTFLEGCRRFYRYAECKKGLEEFYSCFLMRQSGEDTSRAPLVLFFDEWAAFSGTLDKKDADACKKLLANLLMLGRSFHVHVIIALQRGDAQHFSAGARDNFNLVIALGNLSTQSKEMFFSDFQKELTNDRRRGTGYILLNGTDLRAVVVPAVRDLEKLHQTIKISVDKIGGG